MFMINLQLEIQRVVLSLKRIAQNVCMKYIRAFFYINTKLKLSFKNFQNKMKCGVCVT